MQGQANHFVRYAPEKMYVVRAIHRTTFLSSNVYTWQPLRDQPLQERDPPPLLRPRNPIVQRPRVPRRRRCRQVLFGGYQDVGLVRSSLLNISLLFVSFFLFFSHIPPYTPIRPFSVLIYTSRTLPISNPHLPDLIATTLLLFQQTFISTNTNHYILQGQILPLPRNRPRHRIPQRQGLGGQDRRPARRQAGHGGASEVDFKFTILRPKEWQSKAPLFKFQISTIVYSSNSSPYFLSFLFSSAIEFIPPVPASGRS